MERRLIVIGGEALPACVVRAAGWRRNRVAELQVVRNDMLRGPVSPLTQSQQQPGGRGPS